MARYRTGDWGDALRGFGQDRSNTGTYNSANAQARLGNYQRALDLYTKVLTEDPAHEDATFNKASLSACYSNNSNNKKKQSKRAAKTSKTSDSDSEQSKQRSATAIRSTIG